MTRKISKIALNLILLLLGVVTVYPFVWMLASSFKKNSEIMALEQHLLPQIFTAENYINMNERFNFMRFFANSLFVTIAFYAFFREQFICHDRHYGYCHLYEYDLRFRAQ